MSDNCIFCKIIAGEIPGKMVYQDDKVVAIEDVNPQAPKHYLIVPRKHIRTTLDLTSADNNLIGHVFQVAGKIAHDMGFSEDLERLTTECVNRQQTMLFSATSGGNGLREIVSKVLRDPLHLKLNMVGDLREL